MTTLFMISGFLAAQPAAGAKALLNVQSDRAGLKIYLDSDSIGRTPIANYETEPGERWVTLFNPDSTQAQYNMLEYGNLGAKLSTLWYLAKVSKSTSRVDLSAGETKSVFLSMRKAERAPCEAKWLAAGIVSTPFVVGAAIGFVIGLLVQGK